MFSVLAKAKNGDDAAALIRPSELPIYDEPNAADEYEYRERPAGRLEGAVGEARRAVTDFVGQYRETFEYTQHVIETGKAHSAGTLDYLQDETNLVPRATAITVGGLTGLVVAALRRRGLFKRLLYTGVGLAVPTSVCYPQQTAAYGRWGLDETQKYGMIAYNFLVGAKPDEASKPSPAGAPLPSVSEKEATRAAPPAAEPPPPAAEPAPAVPEPAPAPAPPAQPAKVRRAPAPAPPAQPAAAPEPAPAPAPSTQPAKVIAPVVPDPGQSNPEDADLYTTRSG